MHSWDTSGMPPLSAGEQVQRASNSLLELLARPELAGLAELLQKAQAMAGG